MYLGGSKKRGTIFVEVLVFLLVLSCINMLLIYTMKGAAATVKKEQCGIIRENKIVNLKLFLEKELQEKENEKVYIQENIINIFREEKSLHIYREKGVVKGVYKDRRGKVLNTMLLGEEVDELKFTENKNKVYVRIKMKGEESLWLLEKEEKEECS